MRLSVKELVVFAMLGALIYASKALMEALPNIHLVGVFVVALTIVYRAKALYPLYVFVLISGFFMGFSTYWLPYLYVWTVLWAAALPLSRVRSAKVLAVLAMLVCGLHGLLFGVLYAPAQALLFGLDFDAMLAWIAAGLPFDLIHGVSNFCCGALIVPIVKLLRNAEKLI